MALFRKRCSKSQKILEQTLILSVYFHWLVTCDLQEKEEALMPALRYFCIRIEEIKMMLKTCFNHKN